MSVAYTAEHGETVLRGTAMTGGTVFGGRIWGATRIVYEGMDVDAVLDAIPGAVCEILTLVDPLDVFMECFVALANGWKPESGSSLARLPFDICVHVAKFCWDIPRRRGESMLRTPPLNPCPALQRPLPYAYQLFRRADGTLHAVFSHSSLPIRCSVADHGFGCTCRHEVAPIPKLLHDAPHAVPSVPGRTYVALIAPVAFPEDWVYAVPRPPPFNLPSWYLAALGGFREATLGV